MAAHHSPATKPINGGGALPGHGGMMCGEIDLLHIAAGPQTVGYLYNFRYRGQSLAYQSGFDASRPPAI